VVPKIGKATFCYVSATRPPPSAAFHTVTEEMTPEWGKKHTAEEQEGYVNEFAELVAQANALTARLVVLTEKTAPQGQSAGEGTAYITSTTIHSLCTHYALTIHSLCTHYALTMHSLYTHSTLTIHSFYTHYALTIHSLCTHYTLTIHSLYTFHG
jgi:hypothetical protein